MAGTQRLQAIAMAFLLSSANAPASGLGVLGVVVQANHASLGAQAAAEGTTVYDGDRLTTEADGAVRLMIGQAVLHLAERSSVVLRDSRASGSGQPGGKQFDAELLAGTAVLSVTAGDAGEIVACAARVRPVTRERGVVRVQILGPHDLLVYAQRGDAEISYRGEKETIAEGKAYHILLGEEDDAQGGSRAKKPGRRSKIILLAAIAGGAAVATGVWLAVRGGHAQGSIESPDKP